MAANNETGALQPLAELVEIAQSRQIPFHSDCVQALGKIPLHCKNLKLDYATGTAHKLGGPKGIGLLYVRKNAVFEPLITGGKQERVRRAGTESVALAYGFAQALTWHLAHLAEMQEQWSSYKKLILQRLQKIDGFFLNGAETSCLPTTINFGFKGISGESLLIALDLAGIGVSMGSACSSGAMQASPVLLAMGLSKALAKSSLRVSMGWGTTAKDIAYFLEQTVLKIARLYEKKRCGSLS